MISTNKKPGATNTGQTQRTSSTGHNINPHLNSKDLANFIDNVLANPKKTIPFFEKYKNEQQRRKLAEQQMDETIEIKNKEISRIEDELRLKDKDIISKNRKNEYLDWRLHTPHIWSPVREISWLKDFFDINISGCIQQIGEALSRGSRGSSFNPRKVAHPKWGIVNIYHGDIIQRFHRVLVEDRNFMKKFRK